MARAADAHTCGLKTDGTLVCWGDNTNGQVDMIFKDGFQQSVSSTGVALVEGADGRA